MVLPGVGRLTAMTLVAEVGDISRFPTARKPCAWAGLTPAVRNPDRKVRHGHITKQGSPWVRWILQEAAQTAKKRPPFAGTTPSSPVAAATASPRWPSPVGCWPAPSISSRNWRPPPEKARPGVLANNRMRLQHGR
jgi:Transposase IS116/IS110/IS902 family